MCFDKAVHGTFTDVSVLAEDEAATTAARVAAFVVRAHVLTAAIVCLTLVHVCNA